MTKNHTIIVADDDPAVCMVVQETLTRQGYTVITADGVESLLDAVATKQADLVITDVVMGDGSGLDALSHIQEHHPKLPVIVMSAHSTLSMTVNAMQGGAFEYITKPFDINDLNETVATALKNKKTAKKPANTPADDGGVGGLVGSASAMQDLFRTLARSAQTDLSVLIMGETGTGKELIARSVHEYSHRQNHPFVAVNMAAIPSELIESTLFGHRKGAYTGAVEHKTGHFEQAHGGTLFLDEIGDMPLSAQTRLLRVLQEGEYTPVGGNTIVKTDVRIVAATHKNLEKLVQAGQFRQDLYYRLNVVPLHVPPLRDRTEDIPALVDKFCDRASGRGVSVVPFDSNAYGVLQDYGWPGNVRELENVVNRLLVQSAGNRITAHMVVAELRPQNTMWSPLSAEEGDNLAEAVHAYLDPAFEYGLPAPGLHARLLAEVERPLIERTLNAVEGNQVQTSEILGMNRNTLRKKIKELRIQTIK